jgi:peptide/nickel transport system permease protein
MGGRVARAMIFLTSISFNLLADGIRSAMEIKE